MELLLLLTALLASLTGNGSGDRAVRQLQGVSVVQAAEAVQASVQPAKHAMVPLPPSSPRVVREAPDKPAFAPLASTHLPFERRLE